MQLSYLLTMTASINDLRLHLDKHELKSGDGKILMPFCMSLLKILDGMQKKLSILEGENKSLKKDLDDLESSSNEHVNHLTTDNSELKSKLEELTIKNDQDNGNMKGKILTMASKVSKLEDDLDTSAANELNDALLISGATVPLETPTENSKQIVIDLL